MKIENKHTLGPWTIEDYGDDETPTLVIHKDSESRVCFMATPGSHGDPEKIEADAHLIAAAPDMLALLQELIDIEGPQPGTAAWAGKVHAIIIKATGQSE